MRKLSHLFPLLVVLISVILRTTPVMAAAPDPGVCQPVRLVVEPLTINQSQPVTIRTIIEKSGDGATTCGATLKINEVSVETKEIYFAATRYDDCGSIACSAGVQELRFTVIIDVPGRYSVDVNGLNGSFIVEEGPPGNGRRLTLDTAVKEMSSPRQSHPEVEDVPAPLPDNRFLMGVIFTAVPILSIITFFLVKKLAKGYRQGKALE